jgi:hypothetical protein
MTTQVTKTIGPASKAVRATVFAAIEDLRAQLADAVRRIDPSPRPSAREHDSAPETIRGWTTVQNRGPTVAASGIKPERSEPSPGSSGARPASEASTHQLAAGANRPGSEPPISSSVYTGPAAGLGSTAPILILIGLAAAVCGCAAPAVRRRLSPRAGWLRSALLASLLEQPG